MGQKGDEVALCLNFENATNTIDELIQTYIGKLPSGLTKSEQLHLEQFIKIQTAGAHHHLQALYLNGFHVGPNLSYDLAFSNNTNYDKFITGIMRHLGDGEIIAKAAQGLPYLEGEKRERLYNALFLIPTARRMNK